MIIKNIMKLLSRNGKYRGTHYIDNVIKFFTVPLLKLYFDKFYSIHKNQIKLTDFTEKELTVSLTSYPARIDTIHYCIKSILCQTVEPTRVVLWLASEQFENVELPQSLLKLKKYGLSIKFCDDIRSYKKYYYSMKNWPDSILITLDDDVFYPEDLIEELLISYKKYPNMVSCLRAHEIKCDQDGNILNYSNWNFTSPGISEPSHRLFQTGVNGVLYPPYVLHDDVFEKDVFMNICKDADDLWLKLMAFRNNTKIVKVNEYSKTMIEIPSTQNTSLMNDNVISGNNNIQLSNILEHYKIDIKSLLKRD